ncbi:hypothetical protein [Rothia nasisuis]|nr:hypothetical protein [Rothia nasisuis]
MPSITSSLNHLIGIFSIQYGKISQQLDIFDLQSKTSCCDDSWKTTKKREVILLLFLLLEEIENPEDARRILDKKEYLQRLLPLFRFSRTIRRISSSEIRENCLSDIEHDIGIEIVETTIIRKNDILEEFQSMGKLNKIAGHDKIEFFLKFHQAVTETHNSTDSGYHIHPIDQKNRHYGYRFLFDSSKTQDDLGWELHGSKNNKKPKPANFTPWGNPSADPIVHSKNARSLWDASLYSVKVTKRFKKHKFKEWSGKFISPGNGTYYLHTLNTNLVGTQTHKF